MPLANTLIIPGEEEDLHLLTQRRDIPRRLDNPLSPIMVLIQLIAKRPEDREHFARRFVHCCVCVFVVVGGGGGGSGFGIVDEGISFPGTFYAGHVTVNGSSVKE